MVGSTKVTAFTRSDSGIRAGRALRSSIEEDEAAAVAAGDRATHLLHLQAEEDTADSDRATMVKGKVKARGDGIRTAATTRGDRTEAPAQAMVDKRRHPTAGRRVSNSLTVAILNLPTGRMQVVATSHRLSNHKAVDMEDTAATRRHHPLLLGTPTHLLPRRTAVRQHRRHRLIRDMGATAEMGRVHHPRRLHGKVSSRAGEGGRAADGGIDLTTVFRQKRLPKSAGRYGLNCSRVYFHSPLRNEREHIVERVKRSSRRDLTGLPHASLTP